MNSYNIHNRKDEINHVITYHAIASSEDDVRRLAEQQGVDLTGYTIELMRSNVKDELHQDYAPSFEECLP